ncbi:hypothetical protein SAMN05660653_02549 [Desulfonatronum thiosulfatophilum]|uniref:Uncharacterized protein n=1 Tax=Desulfonatronum thiosulfatophilum TaxID=617002 RepID=A0A1G6E227_9BACT|nr:hypothetical protein SAMN05660653_02549 [Desulfonatronum thiosulfatophilum]
MAWMSAFAGMTCLESYLMEVIPAKAGIQLQSNSQAVTELFKLQHSQLLCLDRR